MSCGLLYGDVCRCVLDCVMCVVVWWRVLLCVARCCVMPHGVVCVCMVVHGVVRRCVLYNIARCCVLLRVVVWYGVMFVVGGCWLLLVVV